MTNPTTSAAAPRAVRRYLGRLAAFLCALALPFALLIGFIGFVPETSQRSLLYTLHYKLDLLRDTRGQGNRILIAGGSASEYGVNCAAIAEATARPTYCVGVTAYLGVEMYLNMLTRYTEPGDTVILMLEHLLLRGAGVDYQVLWQACGTDPDAWACVPPTLYLGAAASAGQYLASRWPANWSPWPPANLRWTSYSYPPGETPHSDDFGPLGDVTLVRENILEHGYNTQDPVTLNAGILDETAVHSIRRFAEKMADRGVTVLFTHAPLNALCIQSGEADNLAYAAAAREALGLPVLVDYPAAIMEAEWFYDSNNHLNTAGAARYTAWLLEALDGLEI